MFTTIKMPTLVKAVERAPVLSHIFQGGALEKVSSPGIKKFVFRYANGAVLELPCAECLIEVHLTD